MSFPSETLAIVCGLAAAASWGIADFLGGIASKRTSAYCVVIVSQLVSSLILILLVLFLTPSAPPGRSLFLAAGAGVSGVVGLTLLYRGLAQGRMGIVAPLSAVIAAALPVVVGVVLEGLPSAWQMVGFVLAMVAVWFLSDGGRISRVRRLEIALALGAGSAFGLFFILVDQVGTASVLWVLLALRLGSLCFHLFYTRLRPVVLQPHRDLLALIAVVGLTDMAGTMFFALATQLGRLDIASVLSSSLATATVVVLAWLLLQERLSLQQWGGVLAAVAALALIAV